MAVSIRQVLGRSDFPAETVSPEALAREKLLREELEKEAAKG